MTAKLKIVCLDRDTLAPFTNLRRPDFPHEWVDYGKTSPDQAAERLQGAAICVVNKVKLTADTIAKCPDLKMISVTATGTDAFDLAACRKQGIVVSNIRGYSVHTVPEHAFGLILALKRQIIPYREDVKNGEWLRANMFTFFNHRIQNLHGQKLAIIGEGSIGQGVATIARGFGMEVMFAAHKGVSGLGPLYTPWDQVIETADVFTLHSPLTPQTRGMIGLAEFKRMKRSAIIVNTARGGLIVEEDLVTAIEQGLIAGAGMDVVEVEPPPADHPFMKLLERPNFILTPHVAWAGEQAMQILADQAIDNIENFVAGKPTNVVT